MQEGWSEKYKKSIDCDNPKGFSQKAHCQGKKKEEVKEDLRKWFGTGGKGGVGGGGWDRYNTKGERIGKCAREPGEPKPKCLSKEKAAKMSKDEIAAAVRRKRKKDPVADRPGKGGKPKMVSNEIDEGILDRLRGKKKIQVGTKATYGGMTQDQIRTQNQQRRINTQTKDKVNNGTYDDPWLRSSPHGEKKYHYRQLRGEEMSLSRMSEAKKQPDHEHSMIRSELETIRKAVDRLKSKMKGEGNVEAWVQSKITKAADYIDSAADYVESGEHNVHGSMDESKKDPCWDTHKQVGMKKKGKKMVPNCVPKEEVSPIVARVLDRHFATEELERIEEENKPTNPKLWSRAKALAKQKFDVYPSAYANGWASKWYKSKGGGWKSTKSEEVEQTQETIEEATRIPSQSGNVYLTTFIWRGKHMVMKLFFPEVKRPSRDEVQDALDKVYPGCTLQRFYPTTFQPTDAVLNVGVKEGSELKYCPKCKKIETRSDCAYGGSYWDDNAKEVSTDENGSMEVSEGAAWTRKEGQNKKGGLNEKGRKSYERENPGSDLKAPSKKVGNPRRASFCARMKGMKKKLTSKKTANDPDSRINKSLRAWNC
jgi:hypothetical protein